MVITGDEIKVSITSRERVHKAYWRQDEKLDTVNRLNAR